MVVIVIAGVLAAVAIALSVRHINIHLRNYLVPDFQLHIVRILAMVPIYSLTSWLALIIKDERGTLILELIRDSYEAYVIYNFVILLINYGGGHMHLCRYLENEPRMGHPFPGNLWLPPLKLGPAFMAGIRVSVLQFVFVKPINSLLKLYLFFHADGTSLHALILAAIMIVNNLSVTAALYGLVLFYHAAEPVLRPYNPLAKFICVKAVVFFSFWQGIALSIAVNVGLIHDVPGFSADEQATGLQDVLICLEMATAAIAHMYVFSYKEYSAEDRGGASAASEALEGNDDEKRNKWRFSAAKNPLLDVVDFRDVLSDAKDRFYGGVGFERELNDGAPIVPGNALGDSMMPSVHAVDRTQTRTGTPSVASSMTVRQQRGGSVTNTAVGAVPVGDMHDNGVSVSTDLMTSPWLLESPTSHTRRPQ